MTQGQNPTTNTETCTLHIGKGYVQSITQSNYIHVHMFSNCSKAQENVCEQGNGEEITFQYSQRENCFIISYS